MTKYSDCAAKAGCRGLNKGISGYHTCARAAGCKKTAATKAKPAKTKAPAKPTRKPKAKPAVTKAKPTRKPKAKPTGIPAPPKPSKPKSTHFDYLRLKRLVSEGDWKTLGENPFKYLNEEEKEFYLYRKWLENRAENAIKLIREDAVKFVKSGKAPRKITGDKDYKKAPITTHLKKLGYDTEDIKKYINGYYGDTLLQYGMGKKML